MFSGESTVYTRGLQKLPRAGRIRLGTQERPLQTLVYFGRGAACVAPCEHDNEFVGSLEKLSDASGPIFNELEVEGTSSPIEVLSPIEHDVRTLMPNRDVLLSVPTATEGGN